MDGQVTNEQPVDVQQELLTQAQEQTQLLKSIRASLVFFVALTCVGLGFWLLALMASVG